jgi:hypothetical protein
MARQHLSHKHLVLCRIERRPPRLDLTLYPYLPKAEVQTTSPHAYLSQSAGWFRALQPRPLRPTRRRLHAYRRW